jgi:predicted ABC-type ATPase
MKNGFILTAAPGVGKTTILPSLLPLLPKSSAVIDGDAVARIHPWELTMFWLNLVQDNILACARVFMNNGISNIVATFCLPSMERIERLSTGLVQIGYRHFIISLYVDDIELRKRHVSRGAIYPVEEDLLKSCIELNNAIRLLKNVLMFDITHLCAGDSAKVIAEAIHNRVSFEE